MKRMKVLVAATLLLLVGCTTTTTNGVTTVTLNTASVNAWGQALVNAADTISSLPGISTTPGGLAVAALSGPISADLAAFNTATNGALTLNYDSTSVPAAVHSLLGDAGKLQTAVGAALGNVGSSQLATATVYFNALKTIVSLVEAAATPSQAAGGPVLPMSEATALAQLHVVFPSHR